MMTKNTASTTQAGYSSLDSLTQNETADVANSPREYGCSLYTFALIIQATVVGYFCYDFYIGRANVDDKTLHLRQQVDDLLKSLKFLDTDDTLPQEADKVINDVITKEINCNPDYILAKYILQSDESRILHRYNEFPRPFLHLTGSKSLRTLENHGRSRVYDMLAVTGWTVQGGNNCSKVDPTLEGTGINITQPGTYLVYSAVTFHTHIQDRVSIHRHMIEYTECFGAARDLPKPLSENAYQIPSGRSRTSYQSGVYQLKKNDLLKVLVKKSPLTTFTDAVDRVDASFGVVAL